MKKLFIKLVPNDFKGSSRNKRELEVVSEYNVDIIVVAKGNTNKIEEYDGYTVHRRATRPLGESNKLKYINRIISVFDWAIYVRRLKPYCISCHDLPALFIGWISTWFRPQNKKPLLIYDSHEFEVGRNTGKKRRMFQTLLIMFVEKFLIRKSSFSIFACESAAKEVQRIYKLNNTPVVVRNIPKYWIIDERKCINKRKELEDAFRVNKEVFLLSYHGLIMKNRAFL